MVSRNAGRSDGRGGVGRDYYRRGPSEVQGQAARQDRPHRRSARFDLDRRSALAQADGCGTRARGGRGGPGGPEGGRGGPGGPEGRERQRRFRSQLNKFLRDEGVLVALTPGSGTDGG